MSSVLRPVRKRKKGRTLGRVEIIRREDYPDLELDAKVELIRSLVPLGLMHVEGHCQVDERGYVIVPRCLASVTSQQAHVTSRHTRNARILNRRWWTARSRCRPTRKRFCTRPCTGKNRCACAADLKPRIWPSRWRVG